MKTHHTTKEGQRIPMWHYKYIDYIAKTYPIIDAEACGYADGDDEYKENMQDNKPIIFDEYPPISTPIDIPLSMKFSYQDEFVRVQFIRAKDMVKFTHLFADLLTENSVDYEIIKTKKDE